MLLLLCQGVCHDISLEISIEEFEGLIQNSLMNFNEPYLV